MIQHYWRLMRLDKPIGIFLLLWPALWALWLAGQGQPNLQVLLVIVLGVVVMRSAGCVINDIADRKIDKHVQRTQQRPLAAGKISLRGAFVCFFILCLLALILVLQLNRLSLYLSLGALFFACLYPFTKRFVQWPQIFLGIAFGFAIPMAFAAQTNTVPILAWYLFVLDIIWVLIYDTMYAMVDREDDLKIGIKSTAILFGHADKLMIAMLQILMIIGFIYLGLWQKLSVSYFIAVLVAAGFCVYHQWLIKGRQPKLCFKAFLNNNYLGLILLLGLIFNFL